MLIYFIHWQEGSARTCRVEIVIPRSSATIRTTPRFNRESTPCGFVAPLFYYYHLPSNRNQTHHTADLLFLAPLSTTVIKSKGQSQQQSCISRILVWLEEGWVFVVASEVATDVLIQSRKNDARWGQAVTQCRALPDLERDVRASANLHPPGFAPDLIR
uniref:Uncharacterized protein n=1 Tax=Oryza rufipogon TaxID=4529 RepID=A0A0E0NHQ4_ORYRU